MASTMNRNLPVTLHIVGMMEHVADVIFAMANVATLPI